jgi:hypothetical protein
MKTSNEFLTKENEKIKELFQEERENLLKEIQNLKESQAESHFFF